MNERKAKAFVVKRAVKADIKTFVQMAKNIRNLCGKANQARDLDELKTVSKTIIREARKLYVVQQQLPETRFSITNDLKYPIKHVIEKAEHIIRFAPIQLRDGGASIQDVKRFFPILQAGNELYEKAQEVAMRIHRDSRGRGKNPGGRY